MQTAPHPCFLYNIIYIRARTRGHGHDLPLTARGTNVPVLAKPNKNHIFASAERGRAQAFPLFAFLGLTILYERKKLSYMTVKIISNPVKICSGIIFTMCFKVNITLIFAEIISEEISIVLIIPKLSRRAALTIANAPFTIRAERKT